MINTEIIIKTELRPCIVAGQKALFHCWEHGGKRMHSGMSIITLGIIEREDGTIHKAYPEEIRFIDLKAERYFYENATALDFERNLKGAGKSEGVNSENKTDANFAAAADNN